MMICNPVPCEDRMVFRTQALSAAIGALGTDGFGTACFAVLEQAFDIDHWAIFRYRGVGPVHCIATASRDHVATARRNVDLFLTRCHRVDPSLLAFRQQRTTQSCLVKINVADISDAQYRSCFETTKVRERMSFFVAHGGDLLQLCIYRVGRLRTFSDTEMRIFATLAGLVVNAAEKHETLCERSAGTPRRLDPDLLERRLQAHGSGLSSRERQVCVCALLGRTIDATARELRIQKTSVITYRQRAYQKLGISRPADLLALMCEATLTREGLPAGREQTNSVD